GIRVFGRFNKGIQEEQIKIGMPVKAETIKIDGQFSYEFSLA
ncbi:MAG: DNA-binding protein, partial [Firmicutes bacterium]|nr:DNA-binding protein [Bacillota bacterium]